jgi:hypothetical protein
MFAFAFAFACDSSGAGASGLPVVAPTAADSATAAGDPAAASPAVANTPSSVRPPVVATPGSAVPPVAATSSAPPAFARHTQIPSAAVAALPGRPDRPRRRAHVLAVIRSDADWQRFAVAGRLARPGTLPADAVAVVVVSGYGGQCHAGDPVWWAEGPRAVVRPAGIRTDCGPGLPTSIVWLPSTGFERVVVESIGEAELVTSP